MRRILFILITSILGVGMLAGGPMASAATRVQETTGSIALPLRFPADATWSSWPGGHRQAYNAVNAVNGVTGYVFPVKDAVWGGAFSMEVTSGATNMEDIDINFYASLNPSLPTGGVNERKAGGESGIVPTGSKFGLVTMFTGANAEFTFRAFAPTKRAASRLGLPPMPSAPGIYPNFGKSPSAWADRLRSRSHVVIAVVDTGINPYHVAYKSPEYAIHPSTYIEGYPADTPALGLTLNQKDYVKARNTDDGPVWSKVKEKRLYWIPGTNIVGAYSVRDYFDDTPGIGDVLPAGIEHSRPIIDDSGHGTGTTSVSGGISVSPTRRIPFGSNPEALIVIVESLGAEAVKWVSEQPWIDFVSGSYGDPAAVPYGTAVPKLPTLPSPVGELDGREYEYTAPFVLRDGRTACFSAGNGLTRTGIAVDRYSSIRPTSGPSWVVTVGATSPRNNQDYGWHSIPVDVSSYGNHWEAADPFSTEGEQAFGGTSNATPVVCGVLSKALLAARRALGDAREGIHIRADGEPVTALGPKGVAGGLLGDGDLGRLELQDAVFKTAVNTPFDAQRHTYDPISIPTNPLIYTQEGYGLVNVETGKVAIDVIFGRAAMPDRASVDSWIGTIDSIRNVLWPPPAYERVPKPAPNKRPKVLGERLPAMGVEGQVTGALILLLIALAVRRLAIIEGR